MGADEDVHQSFAEERGVFGDHDTEHGRSTWTVVVPLGGLDSVMVPSRAATRAVMPARPVPRAGSAPPVPSSWIRTRSRPAAAEAFTVMTLAAACLTAFVSASAMTKYAVHSTVDDGRSGRSTATAIGTADRSASSWTAAARPWSVRTCGWMPRI